MFRFDFANPYLIYVVYNALVIVTVLSFFRFKGFFQRNETAVLRLSGVVLLYSQVVLYILPLADGRYTLPFFICRITTLLVLFYFFFGGRFLHAILFFFGSTGLFAVWIPAGPIENIANLTEYYFIGHFFVAVFPFYLVAVKNYRPKRSTAIAMAIGFGVFLAAFIPWNEAMGWNYFFLSHRNPLFDLFSWMNYYVFAVLHAIGLLLWFLILVKIADAYYRRNS